MPLSAAFSEEVETIGSDAAGVTKTMQVQSGRLKKRVRLSVPVVISSPEDPSTGERTSTENVCPTGARLLTKHAKRLNERLMIRSLVDDLRRLGRVIYCQPLRNGRFGVGVEFENMSSNEPRKPER